MGPKMAEQTVDAFTYDFLKKVSRILKPETLILLCPKTTLALLGTEKAEFSEEELTGPVSYGKGCIEMIGKAQFVGQMCIKNIGYKLEFGKIKTVKLK